MLRILPEKNQSQNNDQRQGRVRKKFYYFEFEAGNGLTNVGADKTGLDWGSASSDAVEIDDINYTFPVGSWTVAVGDSMDASKTWPNACSMNNMVDNLGDCGAANSVDLSGDVSLSAATGFGDGWEFGIGASKRLLIV